MYPEWPQSAADLVPSPHCDGRKLKPFPFQGSQKIEFLAYLGEGTHAHVFKVQIRGMVYALKLVREVKPMSERKVRGLTHLQFRFCSDDQWGPPIADVDDRDALSIFYNYSEPFNSECRAFGRLQEAGHEELAIKCFGYVLLDEEHERVVMSQFSSLGIRNPLWDLENTGESDEDLRSLFPGKDGRPAPIRGIVKEFGPAMEDMRTRDVKRIHKDAISLHQLGIIKLDVADRQLIDGKLSDFSTAFTTPHFVTTPELNPYLTPESVCVMKYETFQISIGDYLEFDAMVRLWNEEHRKGKSQISFHSFSDANYYVHHARYRLRNTPSRQRVYTFVDPRHYNWRDHSVRPGEKNQRKRKLGRKAKGRGHCNAQTRATKTRVQLAAKPARWYFDGNDEAAMWLKRPDYSYSLIWEVRNGLIFPRKREGY